MHLLADPTQLVLNFGFAALLAFFVMKLNLSDSLYVAGIAATSTIMAGSAADILQTTLYVGRERHEPSVVVE